MSARRLAPVVSLVLALAYPTQSSASEGGGAPQPKQPVSRTDVIEGRATPEQTLELLRSSLRIAGGQSASEPEPEPESSPAPPPTLEGGYVYPLLSTDLQGDGDDEVVLQQYSQRSHIVIVDDGDVIWRDQVPRRSYLVGALSADLHFLEGEEVLFVLYRWNADKIVLATVGQYGLTSSTSFPSEYTELNGLVEVDGDEQLEMAISEWSAGNGALSLATYDVGVGFRLSSVRATPERLLNRNLGAQGFVTDGAGTAADEAVFVTPLAGGFYAERVNLLTGAQSTFEFTPGADAPSLYQGLDYTGDGRRDGFISEYVSGDEDPETVFGVFDADSLSTSWTATSLSTFFFYGAPYPTGDANGDGGEDLCLDEREYDFESEEGISMTLNVRCLVGASGTELWRTTRSGSGGSWATASLDSDVDGDGVTDALVVTYGWSACTEPETCNFSFDGSALSGKDGTVLWTTQSSADSGLVWGLTAANLDGSAGDDAIVDTYDPRDEGNGHFMVHNGLSLEPAWTGVVDTGGLDSYVETAIDGDLDGDGDLDALVTVTAYRETGEEECYEYPGGEHCYPVYEEHPFVAGFEPGGELLWQLEL